MNSYYKTKKLAVSTYVLLFLCILSGYYFYSSYFKEDNRDVGLIYIINAYVSLFVFSSLYTFIYPPIIKDSEYDVEKGIGKNRLVFRFVSKGVNKQTITDSVDDLYKLLHHNIPVNLWSIDVVVDNHVEINKYNVRTLLVPKDYKIEYNGSETKYKARALEYACNYDNKDIEDYWVVHLDEETHLNISTILELYEFSNKYPEKIGQGIITYMNKFKFEGFIHFLNTLSDSFRVTDDVGRFRLQYHLGIPFSGMKGSFIIVKNSIEKKIGFNYGEDASITEDCHFALKAWQEGYKFGFVPAIMFERSPFTFYDFIRQRGRWYRGLWKVVFSKSIMLRYRLFLGFMMTLWSISPSTIFIVMFSIGFQINSFFNVLFMIFGILYVYFYMYGCMFTLIFNNSFFLFFPIMLAQLLAIPYSSVLETISVFYAWIEMLRKDTSFYVVKK
jgi:beta-1,4-mannosyltransferase